MTKGKQDKQEETRHLSETQHELLRAKL